MYLSMKSERRSEPDLSDQRERPPFGQQHHGRALLLAGRHRMGVTLPALRGGSESTAPRTKAAGIYRSTSECDGLFPKWIAHDKLPPLQELMPWANDNPQTPNEAFFTRMDAII